LAAARKDRVLVLRVAAADRLDTSGRLVLQRLLRGGRGRHPLVLLTAGPPGGPLGPPPPPRHAAALAAPAVPRVGPSAVPRRRGPRRAAGGRARDVQRLAGQPHRGARTPGAAGPAARPARRLPRPRSGRGAAAGAAPPAAVRAAGAAAAGWRTAGARR